MKQAGLLLMMVVLAALTCEASEQIAPVHLGGYVLGENIQAFSGLLDDTSTRKIRYGEYLGETDIIPGGGFVSGSVAYGTCAMEGMVVRIKLKFRDASRPFFNKLLQRYKDRFGEPDEYKGDPFHTFIAWKWSFHHTSLGNISLILQHNAMNPDEKQGNAVKMSLTTQMENEQRCYDAAQEKASGGKNGGILVDKPDWKRYVPY